MKMYEDSKNIRIKLFYWNNLIFYSFNQFTSNHFYLLSHINNIFHNLQPFLRCFIDQKREKIPASNNYSFIISFCLFPLIQDFYNNSSLNRLP